jgi:hypothetical protein
MGEIESEAGAKRPDAEAAPPRKPWTTPVLTLVSMSYAETTLRGTGTDGPVDYS